MLLSIEPAPWPPEIGDLLANDVILRFDEHDGWLQLSTDTLASILLHIKKIDINSPFIYLGRFKETECLWFSERQVGISHKEFWSAFRLVGKLKEEHG